MMTNNPGRPSGLYVHIPFCSTRCPYCDFYSTTGGPGGLPQSGRFTADLVREASLTCGDPPGVEQKSAIFDTLYLGGGTPSLIDPEHLSSMIAGLRTKVQVRDDAEVTIEANPDDVKEGRAARWLEAGVNRISLGVQSFNDRALELLGRRHDAAGSRRALEILLETGFERIGIDLMYGVPGMSAGEWALVLREAASFRPSHISCYMLGIVDSTPMGAALEQGRIKQQGEDELRSLFLTTSRFLCDKGYGHYEVSNYALGAENVSRHNSKYWDHTPYVGLGPSAHSFDGRRRWWNPADLARWTDAVESGGDPREGSETLSPGQLAMEKLYFGFRTKRGVDLETVRTFDRGEEVLERLLSEGYLLIEGERAVPTLEGYLFSDRLPSMFF